MRAPDPTVARAATERRSVAPYALCTTPFCGGELLGRMLQDTLVAGKPAPFFEREQYRRRGAALGATTVEDYIRRLTEAESGPGGVFGFEIQWPQFVEFFSARDPRESFPGLRAVFVTRRDKLAQALEWALAEQLEQGRTKPAFEPERIRRLRQRIEDEERSLATLIRDGALAEIPAVHEDLVRAPRQELARILSALGIQPPPGASLPSTAPAPDEARRERLAEWERRFLRHERTRMSSAAVPARAAPASWLGRVRTWFGRSGPAGALLGGSTGKLRAFECEEHNIPERLPADWVHGARVTLVNAGNFVWRARPVGAEGRFERGEIALVVRFDGEWVATHKLPRAAVAPGESVTIHFALRTPSVPGKHELTIDLCEWQVTHFQDAGFVPPTLAIQIERPSKRKSAELQRVAARVNPWHFAPSGGVLEGSEGHLYPVYVTRAKGCKIWDLEGREYVDYTMANGSALLGHADARVLAAIRAVMEDIGPLTQLPHPLETEVSRMLAEDFPCAEMVTFGKNGSDVCTVVARLARAFTGKAHIVYRGFHGWQDFWAEQPGFADGAIPARPEVLMHAFRYNDRADFLRVYERWKGELAAIIVEPTAWGGDQVGYEMDDPAFLEMVAEAARDAGALLIFDEIITAYRHPHGSLQRATGIIPDLACVSKAIASGMPLAAALGRADVMKTCLPRIFYPGPTFRGEIYSLAAAKATIEIYRKEPVAAHVHDYGTRLKEGLDRLCRELGLAGKCAGPPYRLMFVFQEPDLEQFRLMRTLYVQELMRGGIVTNIGTMVPSYAHDEAALAQTLAVAGAALEKIAQARHRGDLARHIEIPPVYF